MSDLLTVSQEQLNDAVEQATLQVSAKLARRVTWRAILVSALVAALISSGISIAVTLVIGDEVRAANGTRIEEIQNSRKSGTIVACEQQNLRHERLFVQIEAEARIQAVKEPKKYRETVAKAGELELLLEAVQPEEDCAARAKLLAEETLRTTPSPRKRIRPPGPLRFPRPGG